MSIVSAGVHPIGARIVPSPQSVEPAPLVLEAADPRRLDDLLTVALANALDLKCRVMLARWRARQAVDARLVAILDDLNDDLDFLADDLGQRILARGRQPRALARDVERHSELPPCRGVSLPETVETTALCIAMSAARRQLLASLTATVREGDKATGEVLSRLLRRLALKSAALTRHAAGVRETR